MIALSEVSKTFRRQGQNFKALDRISLDIGDQEIYGIIGFSGAGKSTLVRCINLLEVPDAGSRVTVNGLELTSLAPRELRRARLDIGMIFQHFNLMPSRTVLENVLYSSIYKLRRAFNRRFPQLSEVPFEYVYGGFIPITGNTQPLFETPSQNVFVGAVGDGTGVTRAATVGTFLADWVTGRDSEELRYVKKAFKPNWLPPEPFRTVGATARLIYEDLHARIEI